MDRMTTAELRKKEIINLCDGARLGFACDFEFDKCTAIITGIIIEVKSGFLGLGASEELLIPWCAIECIGEDTILVKLDIHDLKSIPKSRGKKLFDIG